MVKSGMYAGSLKSKGSGGSYFLTSTGCMQGKNPAGKLSNQEAAAMRYQPSGEAGIFLSLGLGQRRQFHCFPPTHPEKNPTATGVQGHCTIMLR